jgi:hypothetical protein
MGKWVNGTVCMIEQWKKHIMRKVEFDYFMRQMETRFARPFPKITR